MDPYLGNRSLVSKSKLLSALIMLIGAILLKLGFPMDTVWQDFLVTVGAVVLGIGSHDYVIASEISGVRKIAFVFVAIVLVLRDLFRLLTGNIKP